MASGSTAPFSGDFSELENVPNLPEGISAEQIFEQNADAIRQAAEARHAAGLSQVNADGGFFDAFVNSSNVASRSKIKFLVSNAGGIKLGFLGGFDISLANFNQSISAQDSSPTALAFNNDGTKLYEAGESNGTIYESTLSTPFDISTASFNQSISSQDKSPTGLAFSNDGTKLFEIGRFGIEIYESTLSTPFDISTASFSQSIGSRDTSPEGLEFNDDGTRMYEIADSQIFQFNLSTPFNLGSANFSQSINTQDSSSRGLAFNNDGTKLFEIGESGDKVYESDLSTPFDISTANFSQSKNTKSSSPKGLAFNTNGTKLYEISSFINEFDVNSGLASSGTVTEKQFTFTDTEGNSFSPSKVGIFPEQNLNGQSISYDLKDSSGTVVRTFNQSDLNQLQSVNTTDDTFQVEVNFSGNGSQTPELEFLDVRGV